MDVDNSTRDTDSRENVHWTFFRKVPILRQSIETKPDITSLRTIICSKSHADVKTATASVLSGAFSAMNDNFQCSASQQPMIWSQDSAPVSRPAVDKNKAPTAAETQANDDSPFLAANQTQSEPNFSSPTKPNYDNDTVILLFSMMKMAGYGNSGQQKKSLKDVFSHCVRLAEQSHGIKRTAQGWQKTLTRSKQ